MRPIVQKLLLFFTVIAGLTLGSFLGGIDLSGQTDPCGFQLTLAGERISWRSLDPIVMTAHESLPTDFRESLRSAIKIWNQALGREVFRLNPVLSRAFDPVQSGENLVWIRADAWPTTPASSAIYSGSAPAVAQAFTEIDRMGLESSQILHARIVLNGVSAKFFKTVPENGRSHMASVLVHELGHVLGLAHVRNVGSIMDDNLAQGQIRDQIDPQTIDSVACEYGSL